MTSPLDPQSPPRAVPDAVAPIGKCPSAVLAAICLRLLCYAIALCCEAALGLTPERLFFLAIYSCLIFFVVRALYQGRAWARWFMFVYSAIVLALLPTRLTNLQPLQVVAVCAQTIFQVLASVPLLFRSTKDWFRYNTSLERASYPPRVSAALEMLTAAGIRRYNYAPPIYRLFWRLGFEVPPPHFAGFFTNCANPGIAAGVVTWFCLLVWFNAATARIPQIVEFAVTVGLLAGVSTAMYYRHGATKYHLPPWSSLPDGPTPKRGHAYVTKLIVFGRPVVSLLAAVWVCFRLGLFAPNLTQVKGMSIEETPLVDLAGHKHSFHELRGQATTVYFWATWCGPCLKHMSELANGQRLPAREPFLPIALEEDPKAVATTLERMGYHGPAGWLRTARPSSCADSQATTSVRFPSS